MNDFVNDISKSRNRTSVPGKVGKWGTQNISYQEGPLKYLAIFRGVDARVLCFKMRIRKKRFLN